MIDIAVSISATNGCSDVVGASIRVSAGRRAQMERRVTQSHRDWLGVGPLLPEGDVGCHIPGFSSIALDMNDSAGPSKDLLQSVPLTRDRQPRTFARAWLNDDTVYLKWLSADAPDAVHFALKGLCEKVTRIGHFCRPLDGYDEGISKNERGEAR